jgi:putative transcriptional regulator
VSVATGVYLSTSPLLLRRLIETAPPRTRVLTGYAGWGPGQLEREIAEGAWILGPADPILVLDRDPEEMWESSLRSMGIDPAAIVPGGAES